MDPRPLTHQDSIRRARPAHGASARPAGLAPAVLLLVVTAAWGATFVVVKDAVAQTPVLHFLAWRFIIAGGLLAVARPRALVRLGWAGWSRGLSLGAMLAGGYLLQTFGLRYTSAALSGFLTGLQVVFAPLLAWLVLRYRPGRRVWAATALATLGLAVISVPGAALGPGELFTVASAVLFGAQIVAVGHWASRRQAYGLATVQLLTVAAICWTAGLASGPPAMPGPRAWVAIVVTAVVATAFAFVVQTWAQAQLSTARAAIIFTMEPVFAAVAAGAAGERLGWTVVAGGALVLVAMLAVDAPLPRPQSGVLYRWKTRPGARSVPVAPDELVTRGTSVAQDDLVAWGTSMAQDDLAELSA